MLDDRGSDIRANEGIDDEGRGGETGDKSSPLEGRNISNNNRREELESAANRRTLLSLL